MYIIEVWVENLFANFLFENLKEISVLKSGNTAWGKNKIIDVGGVSYKLTEFFIKHTH